jgi:hypothetical protein
LILVRLSIALVNSGDDCPERYRLEGLVAMSAIRWCNIRRQIGAPLLFFLIALLLPIATLGQTQQPIFPATQVIAPTGVVLSVATGDFNGDGQPDVAYVAVPSTSTQGAPPVSLTVLLNQGATNPPIAVTTNSLNGCSGDTSSLAAADMNKDNKLDLVLTCAASYVAVLIGNGDGSFQSPVYYAVSGLKTLAPPVDLNGDGYLDVAVSTLVGNAPAVAVLLNQGSTAPGKLSTPASYPSPAGLIPGPAATGDFNGDGKQDIVVGGSSLAVFYGNGDGTLQTAQSTSGSGNPATGDFNHDGVTDIAYVTTPNVQGTSSLQVLLGSSSGKLISGINLPLDYFLANAFPYIVPSTNGGNQVDLALVGGYTSILPGDGNGGFTVGNSYVLSGYPSATQVGSDGKTSLVFSAAPGFSILAGNGDGTFQGTLRIPLNPATTLVLGTANGQFVAADLNGDGLTDVLGINASFDLISSLGRGDGTFAPANTFPGSNLGNLAAGDFNGDSKIDVIGISQGIQDSALSFYSGNGDGTFQPSLPAIDLTTPGAQVPVTGDFNGDNHLDVVVPYSLTFPATGSGLIFLPGKGDGTFGRPVLFSQQNTSVSQQVVAADLNNDKKLDLIWNGAVYLGNGDGTFQQIPFPIGGAPLAVADLNGDGIPDVVMGSTLLTYSGATGGYVYAGNGNGTFQASPFYTFPSQYVSPVSASVGDLNGDGHPDLLLQYFTTSNFYGAGVALGDGAGHFTLDNNTYYTSVINGYTTGGALARLNNQAPKLPNDNALDFLSFSVGAVIPLLNQSNPKPTAPPPDFGVTVSPATATVTAGQSAVATLTVTPIGGYSGTVNFSCGTLPGGAACLFAPSSVTPAAGVPATGKLTITTTAPSSAMDRGVPRPLEGIALMSVGVLLFLPGRRLNRRGIYSTVVMLFLICGIVSLSGCSSSGGSSNPSNPSNPGTPGGTQTVTVSATDASGKLTHSVTLQIVVQ